MIKAIDTSAPSLSSKPQAVAEKTFWQRHLPEIAILAGYVCLICWLGIHHEPWRDEADIWLVGRDNSFAGIVHIAGYTGSPILWQSMVWALAKIGLPYQSMHCLNALFAAAAAAILLFRAPFGLTFKVFLLFSYLFSYEYPVIARSYQLSILIIFALAAMHNSRSKHPLFYSILIALLANTNAHGLIIAVSITAVNTLAMLRNKVNIRFLGKALLPAAIGIVLSAVQLWQPADGQSTIWERKLEWQPLVVATREAFVPTTSNLNHCLKPGLGRNFQDDIMLVPALFALAAVLFRIRRSPHAVGTFALTWIGLFGLFEFVYLGFIRHWGFLFVTALYCMWVANLNSDGQRSKQPLYKLTNAALMVALLISVSTAVNAWICDSKKMFSGGKAVAAFIQRYKLDKRMPIAAHRSFAGESILPYLSANTRLFYPESNRFGTHMLWNNKTINEDLTEDQLFKVLDDQFNSSPRLLLVATPWSLKSAKSHGFRRVFKTPSPITTDERYFVYYRDTAKSKPKSSAKARSVQ